MIQATDGGRGHANHEKIQTAIAVEIAEAMGHAKSMRLLFKLLVGPFPLAISLIQVKIHAGKITDHHYIQPIAVIQVDQGGAVDTPMTSRRQTAG